jgi:exosortase/archaeosortase family protein
MNRRDGAFVAMLLLLAGFVWVRDRSWMSSAADALPIVCALPLFVWLAGPWRFRSRPTPLSPGWLMGSGLVFLSGIVADATLLLALGWTSLLWAWLSVRLAPSRLPAVKRLMILPVLAFPWLVLDGQAVGWWFRISGAWVAGGLFSLAGLDVVRDGTRLLVEGLPVDVSAACAGLNTLQAMLIAGTSAAYLFLGNHSGYWPNILLLALFSWMANTFRIIAICLAALTVSPAFAAGLFHRWGGWLVLFVMFGLCCWIFFLQNTGGQRPREDVT